jgi:RNA polymerase sigma factor (sigma-70 family)
VLALSDDELIRRFVESRDESAFRALYARHTPAVYGLLRRLSGAAVSDADDALQDAWLRAATKLPGFRKESAFRTWLTGIALNCLRERWRAARRVDERVPVEPRAARDDRVLDVADVLDALGAMHREVLVLHDVEGYTHEEIAAVLGIETGTSKSRLSRARQLFRERWCQTPSAGRTRS